MDNETLLKAIQTMLYDLEMDMNKGFLSICRSLDNITIDTNSMMDVQCNKIDC